MTTSTPSRAAALRLFQSGVLREAHRIAAHPDLVWQQMYNRLQWDGPAAARLEPEYRKRAAPGSRPWLRARRPFRESRYLIRTLSGHGRGVNACVVSRDGSTVVSASDDHTVKLWNLVTGEIRLSLSCEAPAASCALTADGRTVIGCDTAGTIRAWDTETGELRQTMAAGSRVHACDLTPDGQLLATACQDGVLRLWDLAKGRAAGELAGHEKDVHDCRFLPDGREIISAGDDGTLVLWSAVTHARIDALEAERRYSFRSCAVSASGRLVAALDDRGRLTVWELAARKIVTNAWKDAGHHPFYWAAPGRAGIIGCVIHPDEKLAVAPSYDRSVSVWDLASSGAVASLHGHTGWVTSCALSGDGTILVSAATDGTLLVWDLAGVGATDTPGRGARYQPVKGCAFTPDGRRAATTCEDKSLTTWDVERNAEIQTFIGGHYNDFLACAIHPEGRLVVTTSTDNSLVVRDLDTGERFASLTGHDVLEYPYLGVFACAFTPGGRFLLSAGGDKTLKLWEAGGWKNVATLEGHTDRVFGCAVSPDGAFAASGGVDGTVRLWNLTSRREIAALRGHKGPVHACAFSPDGFSLASGGGGGTISKDFKVRLWDPDTGRLTAVLEGHRAPVRALAFTPDGAFCVSAGEDATLRVWKVPPPSFGGEVEPGEQVATMFLSGKTYCVAPHPWRPVIGCGDHGGNFYLLDLEGVEYGPIVVTPKDLGGGPVLRCPACGLSFPLQTEWLGQVRPCPGEGCGLTLRINPFVAVT